MEKINAIYARETESRGHEGLLRALERRLYALPTLQQKLRDDMDYLAQPQTEGAPERSRCIVRNTRSSRRLDKDEILETIIGDTMAKIEADKHEIRLVRNALKDIEADDYYPAVACKYFRRMKDADIAELLYCDTTTIWRNRKRLLSRLMIRLYGAAAI